MSSSRQRASTFSPKHPEAALCERTRLVDVYSLGLIDRPGGDMYREVIETVARMCDVPMAAFSLVDFDRQWFVAGVGLETCQTPRRGSFCDHAIRQSDVFVVEDALLDPRFVAHPMVVQAPGIQFYAAQTIFGPNKQPVGTLCILDTKPRDLTMTQLQTLRRYARDIEHTFGGRVLDAEQARRHQMRGMLASTRCNIDWLAERADTLEDREAFADIKETLDILTGLVDSPLSYESLGEDTTEWELDVEAETWEVAPEERTGL